ncbi:MAG: hypothetical protein Q9225_007816, partial [Loekoesia sp. 1 TL-2023]
MDARASSNDTVDSSSAEQPDSINDTKLSKQYQVPPPDPITSFAALKDRIKHHYELASDYYYTLWGEHVHHGYFLEPADTKERAQTRLIELLLDHAQLEEGSTALDVGCGLGGTSRYLAKYHDCKVTGVTISGKQVQMAVKLTMDEAGDHETQGAAGNLIKLARGSVRFIELDAEKLA